MALIYTFDPGCVKIKWVGIGLPATVIGFPENISRKEEHVSTKVS
jgi:hypothetical protein